MGDTPSTWGPPKLVGKKGSSGLVASLWPVLRSIYDMIAPAVLQTHPLSVGGRGLEGEVDG